MCNVHTRQTKEIAKTLSCWLMFIKYVENCACLHKLYFTNFASFFLTQTFGLL